jgi:hypothetical protein
MSLSLSALGLAQAERIVVEITGRQMLPRSESLAERLDDWLGGRLSRSQYIRSAPASDNGVRVHRDGPMTAPELLALATEVCSTNGVTLVPVGEKYFRAVQNSKPPSNPLQHSFPKDS